MQPDTIKLLHEQLKQELADSEFESANKTLASLLDCLSNLPDNWQESQTWIDSVAAADQYLTEIQPQLEAEQDNARATLNKIGKSKKGVKAYTK